MLLYYINSVQGAVSRMTHPTLIDLPKPIIKSRERNQTLEQQGLQAGLDPILARIIAGRPIREDIPTLQALIPKLKELHFPHTMADMEKAANRVTQAILEGECIGIETDHDCDGQTSHAVLFHNLVNRFLHPEQKLRSYIGHRLTEGYGLSESVANRILQDNPRPTLIITADNGSSDEPRIATLKAAGIDVIITDHHEIPKEGTPKSAFACLNPTRSDCEYGDPFIAGCMVAWLLMTSVRQKLIDTQYLPPNTPSLIDSLDFVAVGTVADCVSMARSINNRAVVLYGLQLIEKGRRSCWRAVKSDVKRKVTSEDLGFKIGPLLNSDGRLSSAFGSVSFLLAENDEEAFNWLLALKEHNEERKKIQKNIVKLGMIEASKQVKNKRLTLCIFLPDGHPGVHGIAASRIKELFGRPTVFFAPKAASASTNASSSSSSSSSSNTSRSTATTPHLLTGSVRGIDAFHVRKALQFVANQHPELILAFGGHSGAGGLTIQSQDFEKFSLAFEEAAKQQLTKELQQSMGPIIWTDGSLSSREFNLEFLEKLSTLEPFGREFESPVFQAEAVLKQIRPIGDGTHARVILDMQGTLLKGVWFGFRASDSDPLPVEPGVQVIVAYSLKENIFQGNRSLDVHIMHLEDSAT